MSIFKASNLFLELHQKIIRMLLTAAIFSLISSTFALPSGAPICRLGGETGGFEKAHGKATSGMKNPLSVLFGNNGLTADIRIEGPYRGLLLWVDEVQLTKDAPRKELHNMGTFSSASELRPVDGCSAMTHKDASVLKSITSKIAWTPEKAGSYEVHAVVFKDQATWAQFKQIIEIKPVTNSDSSISPPDKTDGQASVLPPKSSHGAQAEVTPDASEKPKGSHHDGHPKKCHPKKY